MKCSSKNSCRALRNTQSRPRAHRRDTIRDTREKAFSLVEVVAALAILAFVSTSVLVVINRCMASAADSVLRMQAFEVARKNMEELLTSDSVAESVEYGDSDRYPDIQWQTTVEAFYEPLTARMWIQAICSTEYTDSAGEVQTVELTHWLTDLTKSQLLQILAQRQEEQEQLTGQAIETLEEAAKYAGVDEQTIQQWVDNGMLKTEDGGYVMNQLDLYKDSGGKPTIEDRMRLDPDKIVPVDKKPKQGERPEPDKQRRTDDAVKTICGYTMEELNQMSFEQVWQILLNCDEF